MIHIYYNLKPRYERGFFCQDLLSKKACILEKQTVETTYVYECVRTADTALWPKFNRSLSHSALFAKRRAKIDVVYVISVFSYKEYKAFTYFCTLLFFLNHNCYLCRFKKSKMSRFLYGIDFGTSNSALSIFDEEKKELVTTISIPSLLYFPDDQDPSKKVKYFTGADAIQGYLQNGMKGRFMKSIKRVLPRSSFVETKIHTEMFNASDLVTLILKDLKAKADAITGCDCKKVILGRPVNFDDDNKAMDELAQRRLKKAAESAGFEELRFQFEPIAAAFTYEQVISKREKVLVADFGGGTTDFTYVELDPAKRNSKERGKDIIATGGIYIGGDSFDSAFMWEKGTPYFGKGVQYESMPGKYLEVPRVFFDNICSWEKMNFFNSQKAQVDLKKYYSYSKQNEKLKNLIALTEHNLGYSIFQSIEKTKVELSSSQKSVFNYSQMGIELEEQVSLDDYQEIIGRDIAKIEKYLDKFLITHKISPDQIDSLFLTGGTSLVTAVQDIFKKKFPGVPVKSEDNFISVAKGLAYSGYLFE